MKVKYALGILILGFLFPLLFFCDSGEDCQSLNIDTQPSSLFENTKAIQLFTQLPAGSELRLIAHSPDKKIASVWNPDGCIYHLEWENGPATARVKSIGKGLSRPAYLQNSPSDPIYGVWSQKTTLFQQTRKQLYQLDFWLQEKDNQGIEWSNRHEYIITNPDSYPGLAINQGVPFSAFVGLSPEIQDNPKLYGLPLQEKYQDTPPFLLAEDPVNIGSMGPTVLPHPDGGFLVIWKSDLRQVKGVIVDQTGQVSQALQTPLIDRVIFSGPVGISYPDRFVLLWIQQDTVGAQQAKGLALNIQSFDWQGQPLSASPSPLFFDTIQDTAPVVWKQGEKTYAVAAVKSPPSLQLIPIGNQPLRTQQFLTLPPETTTEFLSVSQSAEQPYVGFSQRYQDSKTQKPQIAHFIAPIPMETES